MDLAWSISYAVQTGRSWIISLEWLILLTGLRATESGIDRRVIQALFLVLAFFLLRLGFPLPSPISDVVGSLVPLRASQLSSPVQKRVKRLVRAAIVLGFSWLRCLAIHSSWMLCLNAARASASGQSTIWFFLVRNRVQNFLADSPGYCIM